MVDKFPDANLLINYMYTSCLHLWIQHSFALAGDGPPTAPLVTIVNFTTEALAAGHLRFDGGDGIASKRYKDGRIDGVSEFKKPSGEFFRVTRLTVIRRRRMFANRASG